MFLPPRLIIIKTLVMGLLTLILTVSTWSVQANDFNQRRADVGLKLFRTFVSADLDIQSKVYNDELLVILTYGSDANIAQAHQKKLKLSFQKVNKTPVVIHVSSINDVLKIQGTKPAALFVSQPLLDEERQALVDYSVKNRIIIFSPYQGDVEQGILAGISVQATVRPLINMTTLKQGNFNIKPFYLKVAKQHE